jgi:hypothetical protein
MLFLLFSMFSFTALSHMEMVKPLPIRSPENPHTPNPDYDYVSPLDPSGSNYPCKGYHTDPFNIAAEYQAGQQYSMQIQGRATHHGGSCQLSLSYDKGKTFRVIKSIIGGCPLQPSYDFTIPANAPSGQALLAWSWFNQVGNREMYMNCAFVKITSSSLNPHQDNTPALDSAPSIFIANVNGPGRCQTIEGQNVKFPYPGDDVEYGHQTDGEGFTCAGTPPSISSPPSTTMQTCPLLPMPLPQASVLLEK